MMKRNTCLTLTNCAAPAKRSKKFPSSIEKTRARLAAGSGTAIALSVGGLLVGTMRHPRKRRGTRDCGNGGRTIQKQRLSLMQSAGSNGSMVLPPKKLSLCGLLRVGAAPSAIGRPVGYSWTTATPRGTSVRFSVRPATPSSDGMSARPTRSSSFSAMWKNIGADQPCHADVLLRLANAEDQP